MPKLNLYNRNIRNTVPALVDELYSIVVGGDQTLNTLTITGSTASTSSISGVLLSSGGIGISNTTEATSSTNGGTITTAGGVGIAKKLYVGGEIIGSNTTNATSSSSGGALTVSGGGAVAQDFYIGGDLHVAGTIIGPEFVPVVTTGTYINISSLSIVNNVSVKSNGSIIFTCVCIVTPTSAIPQDTSFRLTIDSGSLPPAVFANAYDIHSVSSGWGNNASNPVSIENITVVGVVGTQDIFVKFTSYDNGQNFIALQIRYTRA
jgi:hypothetical protein